MIYILVALQNEFSHHFEASDGATLIYTGVGKVNATRHATEVACKDDCSEIINYGTAGVLNRDLIGKLSLVGSVCQRDMDARPIADLGTTPFEDSPLSGTIPLSDSSDIVLSTGDNFVHQIPEMKSDLVDMEGYAIAKVAKHFGKKVTLLKYGTDFPGESDGAKQWEENCAKGAGLFLDWFNNQHQ